LHHPKRYKAKHILIEDLEDAEYVLEKLASGEKFEDLASELSECQSAEKGGDLGIFNSGVMVPEFERALSKMEIGEISKPVKSKFGYHIILKMKV